MTTTQSVPIIPSFDEEETGRKLAIICSKGNLDMAYPGLILANAALGEGVETHLFFTFWGFDMINKRTMGDLKFTMLGNTATHLPQGLGGLPGMTTMATRQMKKSIEEIGVPEVPEFLQQIVDSGGHLWACRMSADMQHLEEADLYDEVEAIISASDFIEKTAGAQLLFIYDAAQLDLGAEYRVVSQGQLGEPDVTITADVTADTGSIAVTLGSRPSMEQRDIMSYLLTGAPATTDPTMQSASSQSTLATGTSLAIGAALGTIAGSAGQELGFDVVQILQDLQGAQTLVAGKYVSPDLYIGFRQPLSASVSQDDDSESGGDVIEFEVEYAAFRKALLNLQGAGDEFRVFLRLRGGY